MKSLLGGLMVCFSLTLFAQKAHQCAEHKVKLSTLQPTASRLAMKSMEGYDVHFYKLDLNIERNSIYLSGNVSIGVKVKSSPFSQFLFELHPNFVIDSVLINGSNATFTRNGSVVSANVPGPAAGVNTLLTTRIFYRGTAPSGASAAIGNGFSTGTSTCWGNQATWSLSQPYAAYEWFPVKQSLPDKADSVEVWITTDTSNKAGSNGLLQQVTPMPNGKHRWEWKSRYPIAYYLISVSVARYVDYTIYAKPSGMTDSIPVVNFIYNNVIGSPNANSTLAFFKTEIDKTTDMINVFSNRYGLYPFRLEKYGHCMAPFSGGMEHQTMTTQGLFNQDLTAHELGHQWFGDYVTCASWKDIWVNEGFATYSEFLYREAAAPGTRLTWLNSKHNSVLSASNGSVYVPDTTSVSRIFSSRLTYNKGALILHMLRYEINNDSLFFQGLRNYLQQYSQGVATGLEFRQVMQNTTGMNFGDFFNQWYTGEGHPTFNVQWNQVGNQVYLQTTQTASFPSVTPLFKMHVNYRLSRSSLPDTVLRLYHDQNLENFIVQVNGTVTAIVLDPEQWVINANGTVIKNTNLILGTEGLLVAEPGLSLYPNPVAEQLHLENKSERTCILNLIDASGKQVRVLKLSPGISLHHLQGLAAGTYHLVSAEGQEQIQLSFVKE